MKGRESGMPVKEMWEGFFDPTAILRALELDAQVHNVAEFGCGYGTFTIPAATIVRGMVYAIDIDAEMTEATRQEAAKHGTKNVETLTRDFISQGTGLQDGSVGYVMLFNILHIEHPETPLREAWRILEVGGKLGIIHWNGDPATPRGPSMDIRPRPEQCIRWAEASGFRHARQHELPPHHYGIVMKREVA